jgi:hypothetical protein
MIGAAAFALVGAMLGFLIPRKAEAPEPPAAAARAEAPAEAAR